MTVKTDPLDDLCGERVLKYVSTDVRHPFNNDAEGIAFGFDGLTVFFFQDPSDGYRSSHYAPLITKEELSSLSGYAATALHDVPVVVSRWTRGTSGPANGIAIIDKRNGRTIALAGTANTDDYYPYFVGKWVPQNLADNSDQPGYGDGFYDL